MKKLDNSTPTTGVVLGIGIGCVVIVICFLSPVIIFYAGSQTVSHSTDQFIIYKSYPIVPEFDNNESCYVRDTGCVAGVLVWIGDEIHKNVKSLDISSEIIMITNDSIQPHVEERLYTTYYTINDIPVGISFAS